MLGSLACGFHRTTRSHQRRIIIEHINRRGSNEQPKRDVTSGANPDDKKLETAPLRTVIKAILVEYLASS